MFEGIARTSRSWRADGRGAVAALALAGALGAAVTTGGSARAADVGWNRLVASGTAVFATSVGGGSGPSGVVTGNAAGHDRESDRTLRRQAPPRSVPSRPGRRLEQHRAAPHRRTAGHRAGPDGDVGWNAVRV
ncbi:hypothetical protein ACR6C2_38540 [Streptomyces sp. INA 01156]